MPNIPPAKFVFASSEPEERQGRALDSIVCGGCIISGGKVVNSVLGPEVRVNSFCQVSDSILFRGVEIGRNSKVHRAIIDKDVVVPEDVEIGLDLDKDRQRGLQVSPNGVVVIGKGEQLQRLSRDAVAT